MKIPHVCLPAATVSFTYPARKEKRENAVSMGRLLRKGTQTVALPAHSVPGTDPGKRHIPLNDAIDTSCV